MIHLFKVSDNSWVFSGTVIPSNLKTDEYVEGVLPLGETWDFSYEYVLVDGVATKGSQIEMPDLPVDIHTEPRIQAYPSIEEQLDMQFHDSVNGTTIWKDTIQAIKDAHPKT
jgi:hypothetical protein